MKKLLCLLLSLMLLVPFAAPAEEEEDLSIEEIDEFVDLDSEGAEATPVPENGEMIEDEETGETYFLTETEQEKYDSLIEEEPEDTGIDPDSLDVNPNLPDNVINILLIGVDTRTSDPQEIIGRGDTQIILSVNRDTGAIKMTSIVRDAYVTVSGFGTKNSSKDKINTSFQRGCMQKKDASIREQTHSGAARAMRTVNYNFEMNIENYVAINFNGLASIIDSLGGIDIDLTKAEAGYINSYLAKHPPAYDNKAKGERVKLEKVSGVQHLDGVQAVMYARIRSISGSNDFTRTDRQRHLLDLLLKKVLQDLDFGTLMDLIDVAVSYADTNMNFQTMFDLARSLLPSLAAKGEGDSLFEQMRIPENGSYSYGTVKGQSVVKFNIAKHAKLLHEFIYGSYYPAE